MAFYGVRSERLVGLQVDPATGSGEIDGALALLEEPLPNQDRATAGADKAWDVKTSTPTSTATPAPTGSPERPRPGPKAIASTAC